ncbi:MAG: PHP domain-containing protein [Desulfobacterium sp.]|nr:PHP domain-containing protein [Desulfobacterium sp.]
MDYDETQGIDLHIHSTASDGTLTPREILLLAEQLGIRAISITDHDTIEGTEQAVLYKKPLSLEFITGVEISSNPPFSLPSTGSLHILGYGIQTNHSGLKAALNRLQTSRKNRNPEILKRLADMGIWITPEEIRKTVGPGQIGRPHIAQVLIAKGFVRNMDDAFETYLGKNRPAYIEKYRIECEHAIQLILSAGGIPVLAHPGIIKTADPDGLSFLVATLKEMGLMGIEVYYPGHSKAQTNQYLQLAQNTDLLVTGGTDFHGSMHPEIQMGKGRGDTFIPYSLYKKLIEKI